MIISYSSASYLSEQIVHRLRIVSVDNRLGKIRDLALYHFSPSPLFLNFCYSVIFILHNS